MSDRTPLRVLVVDDDAMIGTLMVAVFGSLGEPDVTVATSQADALAQIDAGWDLVMVDKRLPDGPGQAVLEAAPRHAPNAYVVQVSGSPEPAVADIPSLVKPILMDDVRQLIDAARAKRASAAT